MSTRCRIAAVYEDNTVHSIYCHHDGYIRKPGVGDTLVNHYTTLSKIKDLMALGDMSVLGETTDHDPNDWDRWMSKVYGLRCEIYRDRGEDDVDEKVFANESEYIDWLKSRDTDEEYFYLYRDREWYVSYDSYDNWYKVIDKL